MLPTVTRWTGDSFFPLGRSAKECDAHLVVGQIYRIELVEQRSEASHRHYFAAVNETWANLPDEMAGKFPNPEMFRKFCLIRTGYCTQRQFAATTRAEANRLFKALASVTDTDEGYALVTIEGTIVTVWRAESQSYRAMGKKRFTESKAAVLDYCASLIGTSAAELQKNAEMAA